MKTINQLPPKKKRGDKYEKILPEIEKVWDLPVSTEENPHGILIETENPASWQSYFYSYRAKKRVNDGIIRDFTFQKVTKTSFNVWRIIKD